MKTYYTGTTIESFRMILKDGMLKVNPPHRVWEEYSNSYIYLIPSDDYKEEGEPFEFCVEQSSFAVSVLEGTNRVIIEIKGLDETCLEKDSDGPVDSVKYPLNIPIENIVNVFIETKNQSNQIKKLIAVTNFVQREKISNIDLEYRFLESDYDEEAVYGMVNIPNIRLVPIKYLIDEQELSNYYLNLIEEVDRNVPFKKRKINDIVEKGI
jgi:hypothetical protein